MLAKVLAWWNGEDEEPVRKPAEEPHVPSYPRIPSGFEIGEGALTLDDMVLGTGGFTTVFVGHYRDQKCAVKLFEGRKRARSTVDAEFKPATDLRDVLWGDERDVFEAEVECLARLWQGGGHENLIRFFGATHTGLSCFNAIVLEYCSGGSFRDQLFVKGEQMSLCSALETYRQVASALAFVHQHRVIHRDVKLANVLLAGPALCRVARMADFGLGKIKDHTHRAPARSLSLLQLSMPCGTRLWMAPELLDEADYDEKVDVYSFGMAILEAYLRESVGRRVRTVSVETPHFGTFQRPLAPDTLHLLVVPIVEVRGVIFLVFVFS